MKTMKTAWRHMRRSPYQSMAAILTMFLTLLVSGVFSVTTAASVAMLQYFEGKPQVTVFFTDKVGKDDVSVLAQKLEATNKVSSTKYVSKEDALALYKEQNKNDPLLLEMVTADILPASLEITPKSPEYLKDIQPLIKETEGVDEVVYQQDIVDALLKWTRGIRIVLGILVAILSVDSLLIIMTITSMKIALKKEEIEILRLVGASRWYIRSPFIFEGGLYGAFGGMLAFIVIAGVIVWQRGLFLTFLGVIPSILALLSDPMGSLFLIAAASFFLVLAGGGFILGAFGSFISVNRYLKH
jgi:cell division transport system permease protein